MIDQGRQVRDGHVSPLTAEFVGSGTYGRLQELIQRGETERLEAEVPELMNAVVLPYLGREATEKSSPEGADSQYRGDDQPDHRDRDPQRVGGNAPRVVGSGAASEERGDGDRQGVAPLDGR